MLFLRFCVSHGFISSRLVKVLALSNFPAFVHYYPCFIGLYGQCCFSLVILYFMGASFSLIDCLEPNGFSAPILLCVCAPKDLTPERLSRL